MSTSLAFLDQPADIGEVDALVFVGRQERLLAEDVRALVPPLPPGVWDEMVRRGDAGDNGRSATTFTGGTPRKVAIGVLPEPCSRHNSPSRAWAIPHLVKAGGTPNRLGVVLAVDQVSHAFAAGLAAARAFPTWQATSRNSETAVRIAFASTEPADVRRVRTGAEAVRFACQMTDVPANQLTTTSLVETAREVASRLPATTVTVIAGDDLLKQGFGGLWNVGKASLHPPALVVLDREGTDRRLGWVGKGIVYDTGGLSIKQKTSMPGMKTDMAGAAAVLAAFAASVQLGSQHAITAVLCIAENAVGPLSMRPDDVITMYSGKTVEVNNTDAEGRLVLADGVSWLARHRSSSEIVDLATLTGAQLVATGKRHAALYCSDAALESRIVASGLASGERLHPIPYAPEFYRSEFQSPVADMKNSVKDRNNAQASCAAQFIGNHLEWDGPWGHVDMAGPSVTGNGRGTGFGVGLLMTLAGVGA